MSDLSEGENYYHPKRNVFDNDAKFEYDSKKETNISDMMPDKSVEYYSTTYTSNKNIKSGLDDDDDDADVDDDDDVDDEEDDDIDDDVESDDEDVDNHENAYNFYDNNSSLSGLTGSNSLTNDYQETYSANHNNLMLTKKDETKMIHMRSFLSKVEKNFTDKHNIMQNIRY